MIETNLYRDHFQNFKRYNIPKAQLIIAHVAKANGQSVVKA